MAYVQAMHGPTGIVALAVVIPVLLASGCSPPRPRLERAAPRLDLKPCGAEVQRHGAGYDAAARECIWQAYLAREPAELTTTRHTMEGDPVTSTIQITPKGVVVVIDSKDRYGQQGVFTHTCRALERIRQSARADRYGFALSGCEGGGAERVAVP
jgi:hypothetical protein